MCASGRRRATFARNPRRRTRPADPLRDHRRRHVSELHQQFAHPRLERCERRRRCRHAFIRRRRRRAHRGRHRYARPPTAQRSASSGRPPRPISEISTGDLPDNEGAQALVDEAIGASCPRRACGSTRSAHSTILTTQRRTSSKPSLVPAVNLAGRSTHLCASFRASRRATRGRAGCGQDARSSSAARARPSRMRLMPMSNSSPKS